MNELNEEFWIKKTERKIVKDAKKDVETEMLTVTLADGNGTRISISGDPTVLGWLESGLDVNVHIKPTVAQKTLSEDAHPAMGKQQPVKEGLTDEDWDPNIDE
jgi:hypothetical protein